MANLELINNNNDGIIELSFIYGNPNAYNYKNGGVWSLGTSLEDNRSKLYLSY